ncbi:MAG TPA: mechanosensitive ion channel domain-containing protein [Edaphobacter sp.]|nr:mechanosensitive ion channel domain-containing protein [Edaphobacter sp.]
MKAVKSLSVLIPAVLLVASLTGLFLTRGSMANLPFLSTRGLSRSSVSGLVDQRPWQTIEALSPLAVSAEEKRHAREAERLADHEVDQAFAQALRQATLDSRSLNGDALKVQQKLTDLQAVVKDDQNRVDALTEELKTPSTKPDAPTQDDLDLAKAQLQLDTDNLNDAGDELARLTGDNRDEIQRELAIRQAAMKRREEQAEAAGPSAMQSARGYRTLAGRISAWLDQRDRADLISTAKAQAESDVKSLLAQQAEIEARLNKPPADGQNGGAKSRVARLAQLHSLSQVRSILDDRVQTQKQLAAVYQQWFDQVGRQHQIVLHLILQSVAVISLLVLCSALFTLAVSKLLDRLHIDRRTLLTLRTVATLAIQFVTLLLVILIVFGVPKQMPTILGLVTAGLTVVFQDFILAFFGWFVLMGKNGIRVGDWVEINGVGGEVVEVGLFRTAVLETGNWTDKGHPTGRRIDFINSYAIRGQYFNFSTSGQWLWDEIHVNLPSGPHGYKVIDAIHQAVRQETEENSQLAVKEWRRATGNHDLSQFSPEPSVDIRPAASGLDVIIRYVTRAADRFNMRNRIYQTVIDLMNKDDDAALQGTGKEQA